MGEWLGVPEPQPAVIFSDDFDDGDISDWTVSAPGDGVFEVSTAEYVSAPYGLHMRSIGTRKAVGVSPAFEFIGMWPQYNSPLSAWEVIKAGPELGKMVFDTFHVRRGGGDLTQIAMIPGDRVGLVHLNDAKDVPRNQATDKDRTYAGQGVIPLREILNGLRQRGFSGPLSVEIFGAVQEQDPGEVCTRAYEATERLLEGL